MHDVIVIGGSYAGLSAAMQLARARRSVLVIDAGLPRNRYATHSHGVLALDGRPGGELLAEARAQLTAYPSVSLQPGRAISARRAGGHFAVQLAEDSAPVPGRRLLLATGLSDSLPAIPGLAERWGKTVLHCPYCHGYEIGGGSIGVLASHPMAAQHAGLIADWGDVTLFTNGGAVELDETARAMLRQRKVKIEEAAVAAIEGDGQAMSALRLADGRAVPLKALFLMAQCRQASGLAEQLGCEFDDTPVGAVIRTDMWKQTTVPGVYAAGDAASMRHNITLASADGVLAGVGAHRSLVEAGETEAEAA